MYAGAGQLDNQLVVRAKCYLDWLGLWLSGSTGDANGLNSPGGENQRLRWTIFQEHDARLLAEEAVRESAGEITGQLPIDAARLQAVQERIDWRYPFATATTAPAKTSVSALRRQRMEADEESVVAGFAGRGGQFHPQKAADGSSAADIGTAHHLFLQRLPLECTSRESDLRDSAARLEQRGGLSSAQVACLDFSALNQFWQSELGRKIRARHQSHPHGIHRELPFTARLSPADLIALKLRPPKPELSADEFVVVHGVTDLVVMLDREIWLVDFKTDRLDERDLPVKIGHYEPQLRLYALALERIYRRPVRQIWLHFLTLRQSVPLH